MYSDKNFVCLFDLSLLYYMPFYFILLDFITLVVFDEKDNLEAPHYAIFSLSSCYFHPHTSI
jgi:hypothetical protein